MWKLKVGATVWFLGEARSRARQPWSHYRVNSGAACCTLGVVVHGHCGSCRKKSAFVAVMAASKTAIRGCLPFWGSWGTVRLVRMSAAAPWGGQRPGNLVPGVDKRPERVHAGFAVFLWARRSLRSVNCLRGRRRPHPGGLAFCLWTVCVAYAWVSGCVFCGYGLCSARPSCLIFSIICNRGCSGFTPHPSPRVVGLREESEF